MGVLDIFIAECRGVAAPSIPPPAWFGRPPGYQVAKDGVLYVTFDGWRWPAPDRLDDRRHTGRVEVEGATGGDNPGPRQPAAAVRDHAVDAEAGQPVIGDIRQQQPLGGEVQVVDYGNHRGAQIRREPR